MDQEQSKDDIAYMALLTRNIPGVGSTPLVAAGTHNNNHPKIDSSSSASALSDSQRRAINTLDAALKDAFFVSEGEESFDTVHIVPKNHIATASSNTLPLPTEAEFLQLAKEMHLISDDQDDDTEDVSCERTFDLKSVLTNTHPGADKIEHALRDIFHHHAAGSHTTQTGEKGSKEGPLALYRVAAASSTRVHIWVLGWVDRQLVGFHTVSIES